MIPISKEACIFSSALFAENSLIFGISKKSIQLAPLKSERNKNIHFLLRPRISPKPAGIVLFTQSDMPIKSINEN